MHVGRQKFEHRTHIILIYYISSFFIYLERFFFQKTFELRGIFSKKSLSR